MEKIHIINSSCFTINGYEFDEELLSENTNKEIQKFLETKKPSQYRIINVVKERTEGATLITVFIAYEV